MGGGLIVNTFFGVEIFSGGGEKSSVGGLGNFRGGLEKFSGGN